MPLVRITDQPGLKHRRLLLNGPPGVGKTTSALTAPKPLGIICYPGEKGWASIPEDDPEVISFKWESDKAVDSAVVVNEITRLTMDLISGKYGQIQTFVGDGIHKLVDYFMDDVTNGAWFAGQEFEPRLYGLAYRKFEGYLSRVSHSQVPVVIFTCWDGDKADRKKKVGEKASDVPTSVRADLPGQLARDVMGEFDIVFHQTIKVVDPGKPGVSVWQTTPDGNVASASIKGPRRITSQFKKFIRATYPSFEEEWSKADMATKGETK